MRMFPIYIGEGKYMIATKGNKRKSKTFYYKHIINNVEFVLDKEGAYICYNKETAEFLANEYFGKRIGEVGFMLREF